MTILMRKIAKAALVTSILALPAISTSANETPNTAPSAAQPVEFNPTSAGARDHHGHKRAAKSAMAKGDIVDTAVAASQFQTLVAAVKAAGLVDTLKGDGPFTVFAPTDQAFAKLPGGTVESLLEPKNRKLLQTILTYHVVPGKVTAGDILGKRLEADTAAGKKLTIDATGGEVRVDTAKVIRADIMTTNGVIHVIDRVMTPSG